MPKNTEQIKGYQQGAADCRAQQVQHQAAGNTGVAKAFADAADANLDAINRAKKGA